MGSHSEQVLGLLPLKVLPIGDTASGVDSSLQRKGDLFSFFSSFVRSFVRFSEVDLSRESNLRAISQYITRCHEKHTQKVVTSRKIQ